MNYYLAAFVAFISYILYKSCIYPLYLSPLSKIPGPPVDNFILGHLASLLNKEIGGALANLAKQYGGIIRCHFIFSTPFLVISDPKLVQQVLLNRPYDYSKLFPKKAKELFGEGIFIAEGNCHKRQRKIMNPSFTFANIKEMVPTFVQAGHKLKDIWMKQIGNKKKERITITDLVGKITLDVIGLVAQAYKAIVGRNPSPLYAALEELFPFIRKFPTAYNKQFDDSIKVIKNISEKLVIEQKNATVRGNDILSLLIKSNENFPVDEQLTHNELISQVMSILFAGHQTTSIALSWILYNLAKNPDVQNRLRKEVLDTFTDRHHCPTFDEIEHLKYLDCVIKESLRIDPPGMKMANLELRIIVAIIIRNLEFRLVDGFTFGKKFFGLSEPLPGIDLWVSK
ncbi:15833_t:CDS:2, partial [Racocetra fulgida]